MRERAAQASVQSERLCFKAMLFMPKKGGKHRTNAKRISILAA
jgi:hypothetical protein